MRYLLASPALASVSQRTDVSFQEARWSPCRSRPKLTQNWVKLCRIQNQIVFFIMQPLDLVQPSVFWALWLAVHHWNAPWYLRFFSSGLATHNGCSHFSALIEHLIVLTFCRVTLTGRAALSLKIYLITLMGNICTYKKNNVQILHNLISLYIIYNVYKQVGLYESATHSVSPCAF